MLILGIVLLGIAHSTDTVRYVDGFGNGSIIPEAIMIHTNANLSGMLEKGFAYSFLVWQNGDREKWIPKGGNATFNNYTNLSLAYHGGLGVLPGECIPRSMNQATVGIGLFYPQNQTGSREQMEAAADLVINLSKAYPLNKTGKKATGIKYVLGQNDAAFFRMENALGSGSNPGGLPYNPWNYSVWRFAEIINERGKSDHISYRVVRGTATYCNLTTGKNITYPVAYLERQNAPTP